MDVDDVALGCRVFIGTVFAVSAVSKVAGRQAFPSFIRSLQRMKVVPSSVTTPLSALVVAGEVAIVGLLAVPARLTGAAGFALALLLLAGFTAAIISVIVRGIDTTCRCFGKTDTPLGPQHVVRNVILLVATGLGLAAELTGSPASAPVLLLAAVVGLLLGGLTTMFDDIVYLFKAPVRR